MLVAKMAFGVNTVTVKAMAFAAFLRTCNKYATRGESTCGFRGSRQRFWRSLNAYFYYT